MIKFRIVIISLTLMVSMVFFSSELRAEQKIGLVNMTKIVQNYTEARSIQANAKSNQQEIRKMVADAEKQLEKQQGTKQKQELEKKLVAKIVQKNKMLAEQLSKKWEIAQGKILKTIKEVAAQEKIDVIFEKQWVITGGEDITDKVLVNLKK